VAIAVTVPENAPDLVEIAVRDRGSGIRADSLEHVFEPFFTTRERGTGLGLANVRKIVECHGGTVRASNGPEGGAVFTVRMPAAQGTAAREGTARRETGNVARGYTERGEAHACARRSSE
jgi:signal transduction histidine kinase